MTAQTPQSDDPRAADDAAVGALCQRLWDAWNQRSSDAFAALFDEDGSVVGFDGSMMDRRTEISAVLGQIFADHQTGAYLGIVRGVRFLAADTAVARAVVGMVPPGQSDLNPAVNSIQTFVAAKRDGEWCIASLQTTPAQFHGRPELVQQLTEELRQLL